MSMVYIVKTPNRNETTTVKEFLEQQKIKYKILYLDKQKQFPVKCPESSKYKVWIVNRYIKGPRLDVSYYCSNEEHAILLALWFSGVIIT